MPTTTFDTLAVARELEAAGIERQHAEAIATAINHGDERAATKADINALKADINALETRLQVTLYRALLIQGGAIVAILAALKLLP